MKSLDVLALEPTQFIAMEDGGNDIEFCSMTTNDHMSRKNCLQIIYLCSKLCFRNLIAPLWIFCKFSVCKLVSCPLRLASCLKFL